MTDTSDAAAGANLMQWQKRQVLKYYSKRPSTPRKPDGPYLIRKPAPLSWRVVRIGIDSSLIDQLR
eukprot:2181801-Pleurochrysis_carterae.AAC.1